MHSRGSAAAVRHLCIVQSDFLAESGNGGLSRAPRAWYGQANPI